VIVAIPLLAAGLLISAEIMFSALRRGAKPPSAGGPQRIAWLAGLGLGAIGVSALVLLAATVPVGRSVAITIIGTAAAVSVVVGLSLLSRR
jgi:hypothetical protein